MKMQRSFVSNSSSTSFICSSKAETHNYPYMQWYPAAFLKENFLKWKDSSDMEWLWRYNSEAFDKLMGLDGTAYVSRPFCRDEAYERGVYLEAFLTDL